MGALYRVRQFTLALGAHLTGDRADHLEQYLDQPQLQLYHQMSSMDRRHCLAVCRALREGGHTDLSLLRAALLHDSGKTLGPVRVWHRVVAVLARALAPGRWAHAQDAQPGTLLYPFYVHRHHAALGADLARHAGAGSEVVWLVAHHEDDMPPVGGDQRMNRLLAALQAADRAN